MNLILVESPTKSNTLQKFLGPKYLVKSSYGHIRDLPKGDLGVDIENDFKPKYVIPPKARKRISELKKYLPQAETVIIATDEDREGEAIGWHLTKVLNLNGEKPYQRIVFHEITKKAVEEALKNPRKIDMNLVNAQQTRRILDRLVGYKLSPFLWKKVSKGLSAGRVQSVAVRLIAEREKEIESFQPQEYWSIEAELQKQKVKEFKALLIKKDDKVISKLDLKTKEETDKIIKDLEAALYKVINIERKEIKRNPLPPFTTSSLQQEAYSRLRFSAKKTMFIAQKLYEKGFITYHRTDSLNLSTQSLFAVKKFIEENYGKNYWAGFLKKYKAKGRVQEAHEAIRPSYPDKIPDNLKLKARLDDSQSRLYDLIWRRFIACQMAQALFDSSQIDISAKNYIFRATGQTLKFDGFLKVYPLKFKEIELPPLEKQETLELKKLIPAQHFTQPPPRYSEATLIKTLEKEGIGRPSTYVPILDTIQRRNYVQKNEQKKFQPTETGVLINDLLMKHFPKIVDLKFTANMEKDLDEIAQGKENWIKTLAGFYQPFEKNLKEKYQELSKEDLIEKTEKVCPKCSSPLIIRWGRFGRFYACSGFPKCKHTEPLKKTTLGIKCPKCSKGEIVEKRSKRGKLFYACNRWPDCDFALWYKPTGETCSKCDSLLVNKSKNQIKCSNKDCDFVKNDKTNSKT